MIYVTTRYSFFWYILTWSHYLIAPLYRTLIMIWCELICDITIAPIYFCNICLNPKGRLICQILSDPKVGLGRYKTNIKPDDTKFHHQAQSNFMNKQRIRQRQNKGRHNGFNTKKSRFSLLQFSQGLATNVPYDDSFVDFCFNNRFCYRVRSGSKEMKRPRKGQLKGKIIEGDPIKVYICNLYVQSYYKIDPASINKTSGSASAENNAYSDILEHAMALTLYFASIFHSAMDLIFPKPPSEPSDGLITAFIMIPITWICISSQLIIACFHIMKQKTKTKRKWRHKRSAEAAAH